MADDRRGHQALVLNRDARAKNDARPIRRCLTLALALAALGGCEKLEFKPFALPGFSVDAPTFVKVDPGASYRAGQAEGKKGFKNVYISWEVGGIMTTEEMPKALAIAMEHLAKGERMDIGEARTVTIGGQTASQVDGKMGAVRLSYTDVVCGKRSVTISVVASADFEKIRDRVLGSFRCAPVASEEAALGDLIPIGADDPAALAGWRYTDDDRSVFSITDGNLVGVFVETNTHDIDPKKLREMLPSFFALGGATFVAKGDEETRTLADGSKRVFERGEIGAEGEFAPAVMTFWTCDDRVRIVLGIVVAAETEQLTGAIDWVSRLRCSRPGDQTSFAAPDSD